MKVGGLRQRSASTALGMLCLVPAHDLSANEGAGPLLGDTEPVRGGERVRRAREARVGEGRTGEESAAE